MTASNLSVKERGKEAGKRIPLVLVHGYPFDGSLWRKQLNNLGSEMWVVAPDLPGFGKSAPLAPPKEATIDQYADALADWAKAQGVEKLTLAGHSMGGYIAFAFARKYPEMLQSLILVATKAGADNEAAKEGRYKTAEGVQEKGPVVAADAMLPKLFAPDAFRQKRELVESVRSMIMSQSKQGIISALYAMASRPDSTPDMANIKVPTLILSGEQDALIPPAEASNMRSHIKNAQAVFVPNTGHLLMLEDPDAVSEVMREFLFSSH